MKKLALVITIIAGMLIGCYSGVNTKNRFKSNSFLEICIVGTIDRETGSTNYETVRIPTSEMLKMGVKTKTNIQGMVYLTSGSHFNIKNPIDTLKLEYTIINMPHKPNGVRRDFDEAIIKAQSLPSSAWRTYTIDTKPIMEEARKQYLNNAFYQRDGMKVILTLYVDVNGDVTQSVEYVALPGHTWTG